MAERVKVGRRNRRRIHTLMPKTVKKIEKRNAPSGRNRSNTLRVIKIGKSIRNISLENVSAVVPCRDIYYIPYNIPLAIFISTILTSITPCRLRITRYVSMSFGNRKFSNQHHLPQSLNNCHRQIKLFL